MRTKAVHILVLFLVVYIGVVVTIGGWIVTFLMLVRDGGLLSGYVSTGFFGGLTLGRVVEVNRKEPLAPFTVALSSRYCKSTHHLEKKSFQLIVWLVPSFTAAVVSVFVIGILSVGPDVHKPHCKCYSSSRKWNDRMDG